ncbi:MAG: MBL fold metallo-hydrolase [Candidatus Bathyarchaeota archaeon]|nr:MBL fold metallo-hydrolase [Candidatus Bathyarchaeota archaeon]
MKAHILNVFSDKALPNSGLKTGWGLSVYIALGGEAVLMDLGCKGECLPHNLQVLNLNAEDISKIVFSHAHSDHTGGLPAFLKARATPIPIIAHPNILEEKAATMNNTQFPAGLPPIPNDLAAKMQLQLSAKPMEVLPNLYTTGEIPLSERLEKQGVATGVLHKVDGAYCWDAVVDDLSLVLNAKDGLVLIMGCCHAGILNVCKKATTLFKRNISAIIGGTHMAEYSLQDVEHVAQTLKDLYGLPELYLCHCTGNKVISQLKEKFGQEKVHDFPAGTKLNFEV